MSDVSKTLAEMRILTVRQPWAWAIMHGGKHVENRVRNIAGDYRGFVAIHAGITAARGGIDEIRSIIGAFPTDFSILEEMPGGAILGVVDLVDVHNSARTSGRCDSDTHTICSEWAEPGLIHLELTNPRPLAEPIPYRGALGLRRLDEETIALITAQLESES